MPTPWWLIGLGIVIGALMAWTCWRATWHIETPHLEQRRAALRGLPKPAPPTGEPRP